MNVIIILSSSLDSSHACSVNLIGQDARVQHLLQIPKQQPMNFIPYFFFRKSYISKMNNKLFPFFLKSKIYMCGPVQKLVLLRKFQCNLYQSTLCNRFVQNIWNYNSLQHFVYTRNFKLSIFTKNIIIYYLHLNLHDMLFFSLFQKTCHTFLLRNN